MRSSSNPRPYIEKNFQPLLIGGLLTFIYGPVLFHWLDGWVNKSISTDHEYFSHGLIGIPYAAYIVWQDRKKWTALPDYSHPLGGFLLGLAAVLYVSGTSIWVNLSFPVMLAGICLWFKGIPGLKLLCFPLVLVFLATPNPIPYLITPYTLPLQTFIAGVSGFLLKQGGFDVAVDGIYISLNGRLVEVAPYCAGLKMLFTSFYVTLMLLHWTKNLKDVKLSCFLLGSSIVISVIANTIRNAILACFHGLGRQDLFTWLHDGWGGDLYSTIMLLFIVLLFKIVQRWQERTPIESPTGEINRDD
ncbi:MAG: hypothetical protein N5P05_003045 [Chroococcopsis gigantea SAG 12.99]|jgi:cyanoexosortase B|nr:cyanoexosortase B [Chlorogloea purpurea SAG 13.99]MDV3001439.1 hypothetical protein [Chroococcopsis gigantea SAG 12.99]